MTVDWVALVVLGVAYLFSMQKSVPMKARLLVFAAACFGIAGWRLYLGGSQTNLLFVGIAAVLGVTYLVRAFRHGA